MNKELLVFGLIFLVVGYIMLLAWARDRRATLFQALLEEGERPYINPRGEIEYFSWGEFFRGIKREWKPSVGLLSLILGIIFTSFEVVKMMIA